MDDTLKRRVGDNSFVESTFLSNVLDDGEVKLVLAEIRVCLLDLVGLLLGANSGHHGVTTGEEGFQNVGSDKAAAALVGLAVPMPLMIDVIGLTCEKYACHDEWYIVEWSEIKSRNCQQN